MKHLALIAGLAGLAATPVLAADPAVGIWQTERDRKDLVSHIKVRECGEKLCGKILRAFNPSGEIVETPNIGKELFWGVEPLGGGEYGNGTVWVPLMNVEARAKMKLNGDTLRVTGCKALICDGQTWQRVR